LIQALKRLYLSAIRLLPKRYFRDFEWHRIVEDDQAAKSTFRTTTEIIVGLALCLAITDLAAGEPQKQLTSKSSEQNPAKT
jgi:hypothetical protein